MSEGEGLIVGLGLVAVIFGGPGLIHLLTDWWRKRKEEKKTWER